MLILHSKLLKHPFHLHNGTGAAHDLFRAYFTTNVTEGLTLPHQDRPRSGLRRLKCHEPKWNWVQSLGSTFGISPRLHAWCLFSRPTTTITEIVPTQKLIIRLRGFSYGHHMKHLQRHNQASDSFSLPKEIYACQWLTSMKKNPIF